MPRASNWADIFTHRWSLDDGSTALAGQWEPSSRTVALEDTEYTSKVLHSLRRGLVKAGTETLNEVKGEVTDNGDFLVTVFLDFLSDRPWRQLF